MSLTYYRHLKFLQLQFEGTLACILSWKSYNHRLCVQTSSTLIFGVCIRDCYVIFRLVSSYECNNQWKGEWFVSKAVWNIIPFQIVEVTASVLFKQTRKCFFSGRNLLCTWKLNWHTLCQWKLNWHTLGVWSITPNALNVSYSSFSSTSGSKLPINMLAPTSKFLWFADAWKHVNVCSGLWTKYWLSIYYCIKANLILKHQFWPIICY